jgi:DNA repair exonuclease SbcCD nuclease subunit
MHSGIQEYLPELLKEKMKVVPLELLPQGFDYYAAGHIHYTQVEDFGGAKIVFPGPLFPTDYNELENHRSGFFISELTKEGLKTEFIPVMTKDLQVINVSAGGKSISRIEQEITNKIELSYLKDKIVLIKIEGILESGRPSDIKFKEIISKAMEKGAYTTKKNTSRLVTKEFEEIEVRKNLSIEELEKEIIKKHLGQMKIWDKENEEKLVLALMSVFEDEKQEGETNYSFEERVRNNAMRVVGI